MIVDLLLAFAAGGAFCVVAQILIDKTSLTPARILVGYVVAGVLLSAMGLYDHLVDIFGAGVTVPLTGFGHVLANGVRTAVDEKGLIGIVSGGLTAAAATTTTVLALSFIVSLFSKGKPK